MLSEFEKALYEFCAIQESLAQHPPRNQWRVYYDANRIVELANGPDWPESSLQWIEVTYDQAKNIGSYKLENGQLIKVDRRRANVVKLYKDPDGKYTTLSGHMALLLEPGESNESTNRYSKIGHS
jgi:hypothetical protein